VWSTLIFFVGEYSSVWPETSHDLSQIQWRFLGGISGRNYSGRIFQKFCANQGYPLPKLVKFRPNFCNFISCPYCAEKKSHKYFHMLFAPRYGGTSINKSQKEDTGNNSQDVIFRKTSFVHSRSGTYYTLLLGYFSLKFLPDIRHCVYWVLAEIWAPYSSHKDW